MDELIIAIENLADRRNVPDHFKARAIEEVKKFQWSKDGREYSIPEFILYFADNYPSRVMFCFMVKAAMISETL